MQLEPYLAYAITQIPRDEAQELLILSRRLQYITCKYSSDYQASETIERLTDVDSAEKVSNQITATYSKKIKFA
jgi:hypothetical protein